MYGTRDAAANWESAYSQVLLDAGFRKGRASPCHFFHEEWQARVLVHGDDFVIVGAEADAKLAEAVVARAYPCVCETLGPGPEHVRELTAIGRRITWEEDGVSVQIDPKYLSEALK